MNMGIIVMQFGTGQCYCYMWLQGVAAVMAPLNEKMDISFGNGFLLVSMLK